MAPGLLSRATGWSSSPRHKASRVACAFPCVHAISNTPARRLGASSARFPSRISLPRFGFRVDPRIVLFEACSAFTRVTACTLAPSPYFVTASPKASTASLPPQLLRLHPAGAFHRVGLSPTGKRRLSTAHPGSGRSQLTAGALGPPPLTNVGRYRSRQQVSTGRLSVTGSRRDHPASVICRNTPAPVRRDGRERTILCQEQCVPSWLPLPPESRGRRKDRGFRRYFPWAL